MRSRARRTALVLVRSLPLLFFFALTVPQFRFPLSSGLFDPAFSRPPFSPMSTTSLSYLASRTHALPSVPQHHHPIVLALVLGDAKLESVVGGRVASAPHNGGPHCPHPYTKAQGGYGGVTGSARRAVRGRRLRMSPPHTSWLAAGIDSRPFAPSSSPVCLTSGCSTHHRTAKNSGRS
jgi:hypothetical protein